MMGTAKAAADLERRKVESLTGELLAVYEELALLHSLGAQLGPLSDEEQVCAVILREAMEVLRADCGWVVLWKNGLRRIPEGCRIHIDFATMDRVTEAVLAPSRDRGVSQVLLHEIEGSHLAGLDAPGRLLACSLSARGMPLAYISVGRRSDGPRFTSADRKLLTAVSSYTGVALENIRLKRSELERKRLEAELELARAIQSSLLPQDFRCVPFLDAAGISLPCHEIGGDYFDLLPLPGGDCLLVIADVAGKGPAAALRAAMLQGIVQVTVSQQFELPMLMKNINRCLRMRAPDSSFVTAFLATVDPHGRIRYSSGGHNPPLLIRATGKIMELSDGGPMMGLLENAVFEEGAAQMSAGDLLLLYTDGVTDAENERGETFGPDRLFALARKQKGLPPEEVKNNLIGAVQDFSGGRPNPDDLTLLVTRFREGN